MTELERRNQIVDRLLEMKPENFNGRDERRIAIGLAIDDFRRETLRDAQSEIARLKAILDGDVECKKMVFEKGHWDLFLSHPVMAVVVAEAVDMFAQAGGINYVSFRVMTKSSGPMELIIQRALGKTPAELNAELRAENEKLKAAVAMLTE